MQPSDEQLQIINAINSGKNVIVDAVAGSGKTTCVLSLADRLEKRILQVTYNKDLKCEVRQKVERLGLQDKLEVQNYHSLACKYYGIDAFTDRNIKQLITDDVPLSRGKVFDLLVIDETQDMKPEYFKLINKFIKDNDLYDVQFLILGDVKQALYQFMGSDSRYLSHFDVVMCCQPFTRLNLYTSYRVTNQIAQFVNEILYKRPATDATASQMQATRDGEKVTLVKYFYYDNDSQKKLVQWIVNKICQLKQKGYKNDDIFILLPTVRSDSKHQLFKLLQNRLAYKGFYIYVPSDDFVEIDPRVMINKIVFTTIHQSKGRERPIVFVFNFDNSYFKYFNRSADPNVCPNTMYVATTRARDQLYVIEGTDQGKLPFVGTMRKNSYLDVVDLRVGCPFIAKSKSSVVRPKFRFLPDNVLETLELLSETCFTRLKPREMDTKFTTVVKNAVTNPDEGEVDLYEYVCDLTGTAIPAYYEAKMGGAVSIIDIMLQFTTDETHMYVVQFLEKFNLTPASYNTGKATLADAVTINDLLYLANVYNTSISGDVYRLRQVMTYDWVYEEDLQSCMDVLKTEIDSTKKTTYEKFFSHTLTFEELGDFYLSGRIDIINGKDLYEIKCTNEITIHHKLQLIYYAWLCQKKHENYYLLNIRTGEKWSLDAKSDACKEMFRIILESRLIDAPCSADDEFINLNKEFSALSKS